MNALLKQFYYAFLILITCPIFGQAILERGPYLQMGTPTSVVIRWRTSIATDSRVQIGFVLGSYLQTYQNPVITNEHEVLIDKLFPDARYYYSIGSSAQVLEGDASNYFTTYPLTGTERKLRFWITGDCGNNSINQHQVRDRYLQYAGSEFTDGWLLLGDNAYNSGLINEYDANFFAQYQGNIMKHTVLWPSPGNHDYANDPVLQRSKQIPYYDLFTLPTEAEAGGVPSHTESYYSYNIGNIHFISMDSYGEEEMGYRMYDTLSPQILWLKEDLELNHQTWTVAYWHHPPHTKGSHDSDTESELVQIRKNLLRILERYSVDLVLCGHSHSYERSKLMRGHYDFSDSFSDIDFSRSNSSANYNGTPDSCPYFKSTSKKGEGVVYIVAGSAGQVGGSTTGFPHPAMHYSNRSVGGSLILEAEENRLDLKWLASDGVVYDSFTMMKNVEKKVSLNLLYGNSIELVASWPGTYLWNKKNETSRSIKVSPATDSVYVVQDNFKCLTDTFKVAVDRVTGLNDPMSYDLTVFPNPSTETIRIQLPHPDFSKIDLSEISGRVISTRYVSNGAMEIAFELKEFQLGHGLYLIKAWDGKRLWVKKVVIN